LPTTAGVGVGEEIAPEADTDIDEFGGVAGFTEADTDAIGLPVFASQH
jgi:hypothetical protein